MNDPLENAFEDLGFRGVDPRQFHDFLTKKLQEKKQLVPTRRTPDRMGMKGHLSIFKILEGGNRELLFAEDNLIMTKGFEILARIWGDPPSPDTFEDLKPASIEVGDPVSPTTSQKTQLDNGILARVFDQVTFLGSPNINGVQFEMIVPKSSPINGSTITEAGMFSNNAGLTSPLTTNLIAYQTFTGIPKNNSFQLAFQWKFTFTEA